MVSTIYNNEELIHVPYNKIILIPTITTLFWTIYFSKNYQKVERRTHAKSVMRGDPIFPECNNLQSLLEKKLTRRTNTFFLTPFLRTVYLKFQFIRKSDWDNKWVLNGNLTEMKGRQKNSTKLISGLFIYLFKIFQL